MNVIVDEKEVVELSKEEKLLLALNEVENQRLYKKAKFLFTKGIYSKETVEKFDEEAYVEVSSKSIKGYSVLADEEGNLFLVKAMKADTECDVYGFEVLSLANVTDEEMKTLQEYKKPVCILKLVLLGLYILFLLAGLYTFFVNIFDSIQASGFDAALSTSYFFAGGFVTIGIGLLLLILKKDKKCCKK